MKLIYLVLLSLTTICTGQDTRLDFSGGNIDNVNYNSGSGISSADKPITFTNLDNGAIVPVQRNYQVGLSPNFNLDPQNEPYVMDFNYHNYDQMTRFLRATTAKFPGLTALYSIGKSVQGLYNSEFAFL